jgi:hypothetical protein
VEAAAWTQQGAEPAFVKAQQRKDQSACNIHVAGTSCGM